MGQRNRDERKQAAYVVVKSRLLDHHIKPALEIQDRIVAELEQRGLLTSGEANVRAVVDGICKKIQFATDPRRALGGPAPARKSVGSVGSELAGADGTRGFGLDDPKREAKLNQINVSLTQHEGQIDNRIFSAVGEAEASDRGWDWAADAHIGDLNSPLGRSGAMLTPVTDRALLKRVKTGLERLRHPYAADLAKR